MTTSVTKPSYAGRLLRVVIGLALIVGGAFAVMRLAFDHDPVPPDTAPSARSSEVRDSLCAAADAVRRGDVGTARRLFFGRTHDQLHRLAGDAAERSRPAAARLLEAKAKVEGGIDPPVATLAEDLEELAVATGGAMVAAGGLAPGPCPG